MQKRQREKVLLKCNFHDSPRRNARKGHTERELFCAMALFAKPLGNFYTELNNFLRMKPNVFGF
jgi:hypothetical protein